MMKSSLTLCMVVAWLMLSASAKQDALTRALDQLEMWRFSAAEREVEAAEKVLGPGPELAYLKGNLALVQGRYQEAVLALQSAAAAEPARGPATELLELVKAINERRDRYLEKMRKEMESVGFSFHAAQPAPVP